MSPLDEIMSMSEACSLLGKRPATLRWWLRTGRLRGKCMDGRAWVFDKQEIERIAARTEKMSA